MRLGVSPAAAPTPTGVFNQRFSWVAGSASLPSICPVYLCVNVGPWCATRALPAPFSSTLSPALLVYLRECGAAGSSSGQTACPFHPTLRQSRSRHRHASPLRPGSLSPPLQPVWMNVYFSFPWCQTSLLFNFLSVLVVGGGTVCLPMPPSWFSQQ